MPMPMRHEPAQAPERRWEQSAAPVHPAPVRAELRTDVQWFRSDGVEVTPHREPAPQDSDPIRDTSLDSTHETVPDDHTADDTAADTADDTGHPVGGEPEAVAEPEPPARKAETDFGDLAGLKQKFQQDQSKWANHGAELRAGAIAEGATDHRGIDDPAARAFGTQAAMPGAELHFEDVSSNAVWRVDGEPLHRMDRRHPSEIDEAGGFDVRPDKQGGDTHDQIANNQGRVVSATRDEFYYEAVQYGEDPPQHGESRWNYKIDAPGGLDLLATLREDGNHALALQADWEAEIGFLGGIDKKHIPHAKEVKWDAGAQKWIPTGEIYYFGTKDGEKGSDV